MKVIKKIKGAAKAVAKQTDMQVLLIVLAGLLTSMGVPGVGWVATAAMPLYVAGRVIERNEREKDRITIQSLRNENVKFKEQPEDREIDLVSELERTAALHKAVELEDVQKVQDFIDIGVYVDSYDENGHTALHIAARNDNKDIAQMLIQAGANVNAKDNYEDTKGRTALDMARKAENKPMIELLTKARSAQIYDQQKEAFRQKKDQEKAKQAVQVVSQKKEKVQQKTRVKEKDLGMER